MEEDWSQFDPVSVSDVETMRQDLGSEYLSKTISELPKYQVEEEEEEKPWWHGVALETGVGLAADWILPGLDPISRGLNYGIGYYTNVVAQKLRGETEISQSEAHTAGGFQAIPFGTTAKGFKGLRRAMYKGAGAGLVGRQVEVGIDEERVLTPGEAITSAGVGAAFGGTLKGATDALPGTIKSTNELFTRLDDQIRGIKSIATGQGLTEVGTGMKTGNEISQRMRMGDAYSKNRKLIKNKEGLPEPVFHGDDILNNFPDDVNTLGTVHDLTGTHTRPDASGLLTGNTVRESVKLEGTFNEYTKRIAETINNTLPKRIRDRLWRLESPGRTAKWHHVGPLKQVASSVNGLTDEAAKNGAQYISDGISRKVGNLWGAGTPLVDEFHRKVHMLFNVGAGKTSTGKLKGYNINQHIEKLGWPENWQQVIPHKDRKPLYDLIINDVVESEAVINTFWTRLNDLVDSSKVNRKQFLDSFFETKMLDSRIKQAYNDPNVTTLTDMMQHITGQTNEALSNIVNLLGNTPKSDVMYPVLLKEQGMQALWEVLEESKKLPEGQFVLPTKIFKKYNIQLSNKQKNVVNQILKDDNAYQHMLRSRNKNIPPADSVWNFGQDN